MLEDMIMSVCSTDTKKSDKEIYTAPKIEKIVKCDDATKNSHDAEFGRLSRTMGLF